MKSAAAAVSCMMRIAIRYTHHAGVVLLVAAAAAVIVALAVAAVHLVPAP
jgi:hypothetical protein